MEDRWLARSTPDRAVWILVNRVNGGEDERHLLGPVYSTPDNIERPAIFLQFGLPFSLIRHENGAFPKRSSNRKNLKTLALRFNVDEKHFP